MGVRVPPGRSWRRSLPSINSSRELLTYPSWPSGWPGPWNVSPFPRRPSSVPPGVIAAPPFQIERYQETSRLFEPAALASYIGGGQLTPYECPAQTPPFGLGRLNVPPPFLPPQRNRNARLPVFEYDTPMCRASGSIGDGRSPRRSSEERRTRRRPVKFLRPPQLGARPIPKAPPVPPKAIPPAAPNTRWTLPTW